MTNKEDYMKLIIGIVATDDCNNVVKSLIKNDYFCTRLTSTGGFLRKGNTVILIGAKATEVDKVIKIIEKESKTRKAMVPSSVVDEYGMTTGAPIEVTVGGATLFILDVKKTVKL